MSASPLTKAVSLGAGAGLRCRACGSQGLSLIVDLGSQPFANSYIPIDRQMEGEVSYPLSLYVCPSCYFAQIPAMADSSTFFSDYLYMSSYSTSWLAHAKDYVDAMVDRFKLDSNSRVVEIASNDGYLLQYVIGKNIPALGVEPAANVAQLARDKGIETRVAFFGAETARALKEEGWGADLVVANNVLAHVPDINDFVRGFSIILNDDGVLTVEFPHLLKTIEEAKFDTIYHEHYSYLSLIALMSLFAKFGLRVFDVEELSTQGGSLRLFVCRKNAKYPEARSIAALLQKERGFGLDDLSTYSTFATRCRKVKNDLLRFLLDCADAGKTVCGYGAAAKGNTLLNYAGVGPDLIQAVVDNNPHKQGHLLPGSRIPVMDPTILDQSVPDYVLILPWNLKEEIGQSLAPLRARGCQLVTAIPSLSVF
jgi:SAM-dependent methyltransferase